MKPEIHLFIIWQRGRYKEQEILADMKEHFTMLKQYAITWTPELVSSNFTRFYGVNLPPKSGKEKECGNGEFLLCLVRDDNPVYAERMTSRGPEVVNINMFDAKDRYRGWTGGGHKVHGTNSEKETNHDLTLLIGKNVEDFLADNKEAQRETLLKDIEGARGWSSMRHLFYVLNNTITYVVLRNFESLPDKHDVTIHGDIDILMENRDNMRYITNAMPVYSEPYRVYHNVAIGEQVVPFDFRYVGDNYYDQAWEEDILRSRKMNMNGFFVTSPENQYYSLLYHAYIQKKAIASDYPNKLSCFAKSIGVEYVNEARVSIKQLDEFMRLHGYEYTKCIDKTVGYNEVNLKLSSYHNRFGGEGIRNVKRLAQDVRTKEEISYVSKVFKKTDSYVKAGTPWLIDNERRCLERIGDGIHFPKELTFGGNEIEHWVEISAMKGQPLFQNRWGIRLSNVRYYAEQILNVLELLYKQNILHRDIHNDNIYIDKNGNVAILDFGFAIDFRNDKDFLCPRNLGMNLAPPTMYSDFYNLARIFEYRWERMPFVARFARELKKIDWEHYQDAEFVEKQIVLTKEALECRFTCKDWCEYLLGKYKVRKYIRHPKRLLRRLAPTVLKPFSYSYEIIKKIGRKVKKLFR